MASIIVMSGDRNEYYPLDRRTHVIGRSEELPIQVVDEYVSRKHLQIRYDENEDCYYATDLGSSHGVFINARKIEEETILTDEDQIRLGDTTIFFSKEDFTDIENALSHIRKTGESEYPTVT